MKSVNFSSWKPGLAGFGALAAATLLTSCASDGAYDAAGYTTVERDGRLYVFVPNSAVHQKFMRGEELAKSTTRVGAGPNGMTVVGEETVNLDKYLAAVNGQ